MSTFLGLIKEIPGISVDRFDGDNLTSSVFFLSHCHTDHMQGLTDAFFEYIQSSDKYIYCSPVTKALLENKFRHKSHCIKEIDVNRPTVIEYRTRNDDAIVVSVTAVSAGHCPGSVMFLFERDTVSVLYTGDFRINPKDLSKLKALHYSGQSKLIPRTFTKIYLDTTFLSNDYVSFPTRQESIVKICQVSKDWLGKDPRNVVILECSALYGSEFLYIELSNMLNMKIHVRDCVYEIYCRIAQLSCHVTNEPCSTRIHACKRKISSPGLHCGVDASNENIMTIIPSILKWRNKDTSVVGEWDDVKPRTFNVCYSTHSSLDELKAFVQYFHATEIYPCVVKTEEASVTYDLLEKIRDQSDEQVTVNPTYRLSLSRRKVSRRVPFKSEYFSSDDESS
ncbi:protein artemis-like isoform X2 [Ceratina calcarata]|uniref:Protein artemis n=1 Tax=Ceratina calcarata TaxID=156304 RepID=A0AAJ7J0N0_9HYME|nr:protein artemis-like isoform X2 [Ceratina calcarata]XP_026669945.1 protein artemis-like isoform X2 [Ceratina calcarata]